MMSEPADLRPRFPRSRLGTVVAVLLLLVAACTEAGSGSEETRPPLTGATVAPSEVAVTPPQPALPDGIVRTTSGDTSGNRFTPGSGRLPAVTPVDIPLEGTPRWVVGAPFDADVVWVVALDDGSLSGWRVEAGHPVSVQLDVAALTPGTPPVVVAGTDTVAVVTPPADTSALSPPLPLPDGGLAYVTADGTFVLEMAGEVDRFEIEALPDTRIVAGAEGLLAVLSAATTRYGHGVLGDGVEAAGVTIVDPVAGRIVAEIEIPEPAVIEGVSALWADADGDGRDDLLVTVSDGTGGARLVVYDGSGVLVAEGPAIGRGNRWRNQLAVSALGSGAQVEVVDVRVPHIGGVVEFFTLEAGRLVRTAELAGFTTHALGSRNLDLGLVADVDGDGRVEVLVPNQSMTALGVLRRTDGGVEVVADIDIPGKLTSNLAAVADEAGRIWFAAGTDRAVLRVWPGAGG